MSSFPKPIVRSAPLLQRVVFKTDRLGEFVGRRELMAQIGHPPDEWLVVLLKEALDNALDACEETLVAPELTIDVSTAPGAVTITDNGPGIAPDTVRNILDYTSRASSREAYVSPTRGAQGNALKCVVAMGFALDGQRGVTVIESRKVLHEITFRVDQLRQRPVIDHQQTSSLLQKGTRLRVDLACPLDEAEAEFLQIADDFAWVNPHLRLRVWCGTVSSVLPANRQIQTGESGVPAIRPRHIGMISRVSPDISQHTLREIRIIGAIAWSANSSPSCAGFLVQQSRSRFSTRPR